LVPIPFEVKVFPGPQRHAWYTMFFTREEEMRFYGEGYIQILILLLSNLV